MVCWRGILPVWRSRRAKARLDTATSTATDLTVAETQLLQATNASTDDCSVALSAAATCALSTGTFGAAPEWADHRLLSRYSNVRFLQRNKLSNQQELEEHTHVW